MGLINRGRLVALGFCFFSFVSVTSAENFVRVYTNPAATLDDASFIDVDVDSIRRGSDGLVYYTMEEDLGRTTAAANCQKRMAYVIGALPDWRSQSFVVVPGSYDAMELDFVCARVR